MTRIRHLAATLSFLTSIGLAAGADPSPGWSEMYLWGDVGLRAVDQEKPDAHRSVKNGKTGKLQRKMPDGPSFSTAGWKETTDTPESFYLSASARLKVDAGPHHGEVDPVTGLLKNGASAGVRVSGYKEFTFSKPTRFSFVHTLGHSDAVADAYPTAVDLSIYQRKVGYMDRVVWVGNGRAGAAFNTGILPAGTYQVQIHMVPFIWAGEVDEKRDDLTLSLESRIDFGPLSKAALGWQKLLTRFSKSAVLLRMTADTLDAGVGKQQKLVRMANRTSPAAFDEAFAVVPQPGKKGLFSIVPTGEAGTVARQFITATSDAVTSYEECRTTRVDFASIAREAVDKGLLPRTVLLQLKWQVPTLPPGMAAEVEWMASIEESGRTAAQVDEVREHYGAAVAAITAGLPLLGEGAGELEGRQDFIIPTIGLAAEELIRQVKADTRLTSGEKEILLGGLELADWTWER